VGIFLVAGLAFIDPGHLKATTTLPAAPQFATAMLIYLFAYSGFERGAVIAGEAREPRRDVPIALAASVAIATLAYGAVLLVCVGILDAPAATEPRGKCHSRRIDTDRQASRGSAHARRGPRAGGDRREDAHDAR